MSGKAAFSDMPPFPVIPRGLQIALRFTPRLFQARRSRSCTRTTGMWSQAFKSVTSRRHEPQPELTFDIVVHFVLVLLLGMLIIWRF